MGHRVDLKTTSPVLKAPLLLHSDMSRGQGWKESRELWTSEPSKTTLVATKATDPSMKPCSWGLLAPFWWEKGFPSLPSYYLHTVRDYIEARPGRLCLPICFFYLKTPPSFSIICSISSLTWRENLASEGSMQSRLSPHPAPPTPTSTPILHIAFGFKRDAPAPSYSLSPWAPSSFGPVPHFPPTIASLVTIICLFHEHAPGG